MTEKTKEVLLRAVDYLKTNDIGTRLNMNSWFTYSFINALGWHTHTEALTLDDVTEVLGCDPSCGTSCCLAGAIVLSAPPEDIKGAETLSDEIQEVAAVLAQLSPSEERHLFFVAQWPPQFYTRYCQVYGPDGNKARVKILEDRIRFFLDTNGTDDPQYLQEA